MQHDRYGKIQSLCLGVVAWGVLATGALAALISNGGFETPTAPSTIGGKTYYQNQSFGEWTVWKGSIDLVRDDFTPDFDGFQSVDLNGYAPGGIYQDVSGLVVGQEYYLSFAISANVFYGLIDPVVQVRWGEGTSTEQLPVIGTFQWLASEHSGHSNSSMKWDTHVVAVTATASTMRLAFGSTSPDGVCGPVLDGVKLEPVPEPSSLVALGGTAVGLAVLSRRRFVRRRSDV
ncbi:MAG: DUF642 domain-containing protein [Thermoguttaceae bacterium]|jgi:hypothetical protein|nr:DUF642 domain-containing protein [Thermoguttaceae bacterium]